MTDAGNVASAGTVPEERRHVMGESRRRRVLIADDEEDMRVMLREVLEDEGYEVDTARDGQEALERLKTTAPDLLVLDLMMPRIDGWMVLEQLRRSANPPPVVVVTGTGAFDEHRPPPEGVAATFSKPFCLATVLGICQALAPTR